LEAFDGSCCCISCLSCSLLRLNSESVMIWLFMRATISSTTLSAYTSGDGKTASNKATITFFMGSTNGRPGLCLRYVGLLSVYCNSGPASGPPTTVMIVSFKMKVAIRPRRGDSEDPQPFPFYFLYLYGLL